MLAPSFNSKSSPTSRIGFDALGIGVAILLCLSAVAVTAGSPRWVISANESKIDLSSGTRRVLMDAPPDTVTFLDFSDFPPAVVHVTNISNTVLGPPSNVAISPDGRFALIADSIQLDPTSTNRFRPARRIHVIDLTTTPPRRVGEGEAGDQPSGVSITPDGKHVVVQCHAERKLWVLDLTTGGKLRDSGLRIDVPGMPSGMRAAR